MGIVLKALDTNLNRTVVLKVLAPTLAANAMGRKRFLREAQAAAAVDGLFAITSDGVLSFRAAPDFEFPNDGSQPTTITLNGGERAISADHRFATGGIFSINVTVTDSDGASDTQTTTAVVTGVRMTDSDELQIIGSDDIDKVEVKFRVSRCCQFRSRLRRTRNSRGWLITVSTRRDPEGAPAEFVVHLQPVLFDPVFNPRPGMALLLAVGQHFPLEITVT